MKREIKSGTSILRRTASEVKRYRILLRITPIILGITTLVLVLTYVITILYDRYGSFSVSVNKFSNVRYALTLSETADFSTQVSRLNSKASVDITNIDGTTLPNDLDSDTGGEKSGQNFLAYTFYCKNTGQEAVLYEYSLAIKNATQDIERAVRVRVYVDGKEETYAAARTDNGEPEEGTTVFYRDNIVMYGQIAGFQPGAITKYTVVVWLEGNDADCVDDIIGGEFKIDMELNILGGEELETMNLEAA